MFRLPQSTEFNKRIPKQKFYENINVTPQLRRIFVDQIKLLSWRNKLATATTNLAPGRAVTEIEVFGIKLADRSLDPDAIKQIDRGIPYHILFLLEHEGQYQAWIGYKEITPAGAVQKLGPYYHTAWMDTSALPLKLDGLDLDKVYENFLRQIAGDALPPAVPGETLAQAIAKEEKRKVLEKQIEKMQEKLRKEKQLNKQVALNAELKSLRKELDLL